MTMPTASKIGQASEVNVLCFDNTVTAGVEIPCEVSCPVVLAVMCKKVLLCVDHGPKGCKKRCIG